MEIAGLTDLLKQEGSYTMFAPTDEAFDGLTKEDFELLKGALNLFMQHIKLYNAVRRREKIGVAYSVKITFFVVTDR